MSIIRYTVKFKRFCPLEKRDSHYKLMSLWVFGTPDQFQLFYIKIWHVLPQSGTAGECQTKEGSGKRLPRQTITVEARFFIKIAHWGRVKIPVENVHVCMRARKTNRYLNADLRCRWFRQLRFSRLSFRSHSLSASQAWNWNWDHLCAPQRT